MIKDIFEKIWTVICISLGSIFILIWFCALGSVLLTYFLANPIHIAYALGGLALIVALIWLSMFEAFQQFIASIVQYFLITILAFVFIAVVGFINGFFPGPIH